jgi:predicted SnoaL-like aldol condensation-catalyzing enzyme
MAMTPADQRTDDPSSPAAVVTSYLTAYLSGEIATAQSLVRDDFSFRAPLIETGGTKDAYFAGSGQKARYIQGFRILRQWQDGDEVAAVYEIDVQTPAGAASMLMHEWHTIRDGKIASTVMIFDMAARAAQLLHDALMPEG